MDIPGLPARKAALRLLDAVLRRGETLDQAGSAALSALRSAPDKALARALAGEVLRWLVDFDALIDSATQQVLPSDAKARIVLRLMLAGWLRLDTPPHAVIATALPLLEGGPKRLAHGVFGALVRQEAKLPAAPTLPGAVRERWGVQAAAIAAGLALPPPLDLTLRDPAMTAEWTERLGGLSLMPGHVRLARGDAVENIEGFGEGAWWVQDLAASLPARLLGPGQGKRVLDLCASPRSMSARGGSSGCRPIWTGPG
jgi:16S rRNA (cytosine967-C5)-methyltransferase